MSKNLEYFININRQKIKNLAQIGAHFGQEIELFEKYEIKNIFLFEPTQKAIDVLQNKILDKSKQDPTLKKDYTKEFELD